MILIPGKGGKQVSVQGQPGKEQVPVCWYIQETEPCRALDSKSISEQAPGQSGLSSEGVGQSKAGDTRTRGPCSSSSKQQNSGSFSHMALALESRMEGTDGTVDAG